MMDISAEGVKKRVILSQTVPKTTTATSIPADSEEFHVTKFS